MVRHTFWVAGLFFGLMVACDQPVPETDGGGGDTDGGELCAVDADCTDGTFCNGVERCAPSATGADARGCAPPAAGACMAGQICDEAADRCTTECDLTGDADGDGHDSADCDGLDCDDSDANRYPGNTEICDAADHDEDCDPETFGFRDGDGDAHPDGRCCNAGTDGVDVCGDDCNDSRPDITSVWSSRATDTTTTATGPPTRASSAPSTSTPTRTTTATTPWRRSWRACARP